MKINEKVVCRDGFELFSKLVSEYGDASDLVGRSINDKEALARWQERKSSARMQLENFMLRIMLGIS